MSEKKKFMNPAKYAFLCALFAILCVPPLLSTVEPPVGVFVFLVIFSVAAFILGLGSLLKSRENIFLAAVALVVSAAGVMASGIFFFLVPETLKK